ncbi:hypothetical protein PCANC_10174 [Puccinia coronata f. sp. avenae]|uniref:Uncharacterized protein n=1 Tax=Puccinia coronata f. sp. avenae TaxID=200324 RepID=A0A2N5VL54_9BASI|nr:hypothetical protein PCANC_10174 [Puccinia coronata f. sp. avenae]PLW50735.1 hypothetical protein PCASD_00660 [Puccinia coronata f. sp. avenae]
MEAPGALGRRLLKAPGLMPTGWLPWARPFFKHGACNPTIQACKPPHATRRPIAYKWREDSQLGVRPRRTGVLAMHACPEGVQALHTLRTGVHGRHACPARLT